MPQVITRRAAYTEQRVNLCARHDNNTDAQMALGRVENGLHEGRCDVCEWLGLYDGGGTVHTGDIRDTREDWRED